MNWRSQLVAVTFFLDLLELGYQNATSDQYGCTCTLHITVSLHTREMLKSFWVERVGDKANFTAKRPTMYTCR